MHNEYFHKTVLNLPVINKPEESAIDAVVNVINNTKQWFGLRQNLFQLASGRSIFENKIQVPLHDLVIPIEPNCERLIEHAIEQIWRLTTSLYYDLRYISSSQNETSNFIYYEATFSQPSVKYPVPQATAAVFFKVEKKLLNPPDYEEVPCMFFRLEGHTMDHDVRYVLLTADWILGIIQMKSKFFKRLEAFRMF